MTGTAWRDDLASSTTTGADPAAARSSRRTRLSPVELGGRKNRHDSHGSHRCRTRLEWRGPLPTFAITVHQYHAPLLPNTDPARARWTARVALDGGKAHHRGARCSLSRAGG